jgi:flavin-dependent dehydrogenase
MPPRLAAASRAFDVVVAGGGLPGISAAFHAAVRHGLRVLVVDEQPLARTSAMSIECYRDYWPWDAGMAQLVRRSITLMEGEDVLAGIVV